jgi:hypothetical protein
LLPDRLVLLGVGSCGGGCFRVSGACCALDATDTTAVSGNAASLFLSFITA